MLQLCIWFMNSVKVTNPKFFSVSHSLIHNFFLQQDVQGTVGFQPSNSRYIGLPLEARALFTSTRFPRLPLVLIYTPRPGYSEPLTPCLPSCYFPNKPNP